MKEKSNRAIHDIQAEDEKRKLGIKMLDKWLKDLEKTNENLGTKGTKDE
ncbi:hypothetical protein [Metabacillus litoralis]|nr:hypothetical protein [Metabacillus litoralis]MCM3160808.1 hypothetical protein [Metabacillus litoralis]